MALKVNTHQNKCFDHLALLVFVFVGASEYFFSSVGKVVFAFILPFINKHSGADPGFLERGLIYLYKGVGVLFADIISLSLNIPCK